MGFYYGPSTPPSRWSVWRRRIARSIPQPIKNWWADVTEIFVITRVVLGIIMPVFALMLVFVFLCAGMMFLYSLLGHAR